MTIDWVHFTPWSALAGGGLIGLGAGLFMLLLGRIAGISGLLSSLLAKGWRDMDSLLFVAGLLLAPVVWGGLQPLPSVDIEANPLVLILAGLLVGFGVRLGSGCTSGHGVCGLARLSGRSLVATLSFMVAGFVCLYLLRHGLGVGL